MFASRITKVFACHYYCCFLNHWWNHTKVAWWWWCCSTLSIINTSPIYHRKWCSFYKLGLEVWTLQDFWWPNQTICDTIFLLKHFLHTQNIKHNWYPIIVMMTDVQTKRVIHACVWRTMQHCYVAALLHSITATLLRSSVAVQQWCYIAALPCSSVAALLCSSVAV